MLKGEVVEAVDVAALPGGARHDYTRALLAAVPQPVVRDATTAGAAALR